MSPRSYFLVWLLPFLSGCAQLSFFAPGQGELRAAVNAARWVRVAGPAEVVLADRTLLVLQPGLSFIPPAEAERLLRSIGQGRRENLLGVVVNNSLESTEAAAVYAKDGHPALPAIEVLGWRRAPGLAELVELK